MSLWSRIKNALAEEIGEAEEKIHHPLYPIQHYSAYVDELLIARGAWPTREELAAMKKQGFKTVVNLCAERNQDKDVSAAGMVPVNIPVRDNTCPTRQQVAQFLELCKAASADAKLYVHCEEGKGRTGCMCAAYEVNVMGRDSAYALYWAQHYGMALPCQIDFVNNLKGGN